MAPSQYSIRFQCGIQGGFAPPNPSEIHSLDKGPGRDDVTIQSMSRKPGQMDLAPAEPKTVAVTKIAKLIDELEGILKGLPTEIPQGCEDIYGLDISIMWASEGLEWFNAGSGGCGGGRSDVQPSKEQKAKFERAVKIVRTIVEG